MGQIRAATCFIVAYILESFFTGIYVVLFAQATYLQISKAHKGQDYNKFIFWSSIYLFFSGISHWLLNLARMFESIFSPPGGESIDHYFLNVQDHKYIGSVWLYSTHSMVGDTVMIYRTYHVYLEQIWVCIAPSISLIVILVCLIVMTVKTFQVSLATVGVYQGHVQPWITAWFSFASFNNLYCTSMIIARLYATHRNVPRSLSGTGPLIRVMEVFLESVAPWTILIFCSYVTFLARSNLVIPLSEITPAVIGISFALIIIRSKYINNATKGTRIGTLPTFRPAVRICDSGNTTATEAEHTETIDL